MVGRIDLTLCVPITDLSVNSAVTVVPTADTSVNYSTWNLVKFFCKSTIECFLITETYTNMETD